MQADGHGAFYAPQVAAPGFTLWAIPVRQDNYIWGLTWSDPSHLHAWIIDPADAAPVKAWLDREQAVLAGILITHRHHDHTGGVPALTAQADIPVYGHADCITVTHPLSDGAKVVLADSGLALTALTAPGHTHELMVYLNSEWLFCGDLIFSYGCGRPMDGTPAQLQRSIARVLGLCQNAGWNPWVCAAHEYTLHNLRFWRSLAPNVLIWQTAQQHAEALRAKGLPTVPFRLHAELNQNPFLALSADIAEPPWLETLAQQSPEANAKDRAALFVTLREARNHF